ncbi:hypothetical protein BDV95DRAFT_563883 [Massariosphaeria phaeospora]|uniref:C2H2-type domain-containing protein n=1 Tax=Massariosphaeria phaeospora TaxID=100035 RepID=A0A7C8IAR3_9PLEO|nr:hypothetical protein BDV95DRAFT_563883 [Massariosphaeria phaeospora]
MRKRDRTMAQSVQKEHSELKGKEPISMASRIAYSASDMAQSLMGSSCAASDFVTSGGGIRSKIANASSSANTPHCLQDLPVRTRRPSTYGNPGSPRSSFRSSPTGEGRCPEFDEFAAGGSALCNDDERMHTDTYSFISARDSGSADMEMACSVEEPYDVFIADRSHSNNTDVDGHKEHSRYNSEKPASFDQHGDLRNTGSAFERQHIDLTQEGLTNFLTGMDHSITQPLSRLELILGHIAETARSASAQHQEHLQRGFYQTEQQGFTTGCTGSRGAFVDAKNFSALGMRPEAHKQNLHSAMRDSLMEDQSMDDEDLEAPTFHCPWIRCHQHFNDAMELRLHRHAHPEYVCPHEDCTAQFRDHKEWVEHIAEPHHDLLENPVRTLISCDA